MRIWAATASALLIPASMAISTPASAVPVTSFCDLDIPTNVVTCTYAPLDRTPYRFSVPDGVTQVTIEVRGASGGDGSVAPGGKGAIATGVLNVTAGQNLDVRVGGRGGDGDGSPSGAGGANGGGSGTSMGTSLGGGGGGWSSVHAGGAVPDETAPLIAAGGGGGGGLGFDDSTKGGNGGGIEGETGSGLPDSGGGGGTQTMGGFFGGGRGTGGPGLLRGGGGGGGFNGGGGGSFDAGGGGGSGHIATSSDLSASFGTATNTGDGKVTITYASPTPPPVLSVADASVNEGDAGEQPTLDFVVSLDKVSTSHWTFEYSTSPASPNEATEGVDYLEAAGSRSILAGQTSVTIPVKVVGDDVAELDETLALEASFASGPTETGLGTITDDDSVPPQPGTLSFSADDHPVAEGDVATVTVTRTGGSDGQVAINVASSDGTAGTGDYTTASETLTFADGATSKTFEVSTVEDPVFEPDETINLTLSSPSGGAVLGDDDATVTIINDDLAGPDCTIGDPDSTTGHVLKGTSGDDVICGGSAGDNIVAGGGSDVIFAGAGNDIIRGNDGGDTIYGGAGNDYLRGDAGDDSLHGGDGNDFLGGDAGSDTLNGDAGRDTLLGNRGSDAIDGGDGDGDRCLPGPDNDPSVTRCP
jgi:hypothetical protein